MKQIGLSVITEGSRWPIWVGAFNMFLDHPFFGVGLDAFRLAFMQYRPDTYWLREWGGTPTRAHNELLHILATQGALGALAVFILTFGIARAFIRAFKDPRPDRILLLAVFSGAICFYVQNLFNFTVTGFGTLFITFSAFLSRLGDHQFSHETSSQEKSVTIVHQKDSLMSVGNFVRGTILIAAVSAAYLLVLRPFQTSRLVAQTIFDRSLPAAEAASRLEKAVSLDSNKDDYFHHLGGAYRKMASKENEPALRANLFILARDAYQRAADLVPIDSNNHIKLATLLVVMAKEPSPLVTPDEIYREIKMAIRLDPKNADIYLIGADIATSFGEGARAARWATQSSAIYPHFAPPHAQRGFVALLDAVRVLKDNRPAEGKKHLQEAISHLTRSIPMFWANHTAKKEAAEDHLATAYLFKARAEGQLGEIENARDSYLKLLKFKPDHAEGIASFEKFQKKHG
jgi:tetratricopeptide (TPR) repeat protein